jgi:predicted unusual protein kinase regulating ubiquinone biosynthesis (AarF/ABC1/UbiB family)
VAALQIKHFKRYKDIAWLLLKYGRSDLVKEIGAEIELSKEQKEQLVANMVTSPEELARDLQEMGPAFIKLGQLLSTQTDYLPDAYSEALAKLQDRADPFPYSEAEKIFTSELGVEIKNAFKEFNPKPIAAASLAQVHKAILPSGRIVAVKIQRPSIQTGIVEDLEVLDELAILLEDRTSWGKKYELKDKVKQLRSTLLNELDYKKEAIHLSNFKRNLQEFKQIIIPSPIADYSTARILTMDFITGQKITQLSPLIKIDLKGEELAEVLFKAYLKQILIDGLVHVDPHPGNIYLTENQQLVILDLGMVAHIPPQMQNGLLKLLLAVSEGQGEEAADIIVRLGEPQNHFSYTRFRDEIATLVANYQDLSVSQMAIGRLILKIARTGGETGIHLPSHFNLLGKALLNLDKVAKTLSPNFVPNASIRQNVAELFDERMRRNFSMGNFYRSFVEAVEFIQHLPTKANNILDILSRNELKLNVDAIDEQRLMIGFEKVANRITLGLILAALIIGAALLMRIETTFTIFGYPGLAIILFLAAACGGVLLMINILLYDEKKNRNS